MADLYSLIDEIKGEFPEFRLKSKSSSGFMRFLNVCLLIITFGQMREFMSSFTTTIGYTIYTPSSWEQLQSDRTKMVILRHERVHMRQKREHGWWFSISYLLLPLPAVWAWYRMKYEMEAYEESVQALWDLYGTRPFTEELREKFIRHFTSAEYFWTWPWRKRIERWYDGLVSRFVDV